MQNRLITLIFHRAFSIVLLVLAAPVALFAQDTAEEPVHPLAASQQDRTGLILYLAAIGVLILSIWLMRQAIKKPTHRAGNVH